MKEVRFGIIGLGSMGTHHARYLINNKIKGARLTAVADINPEKLRWAEESGIQSFTDENAFYCSGLFDAVLIATPHYHHPPIAIKAFEHGLNVLSEKPAGVYTKQVREMNEKAEESKQVFSIMFNQRTNPLYQKLRELIQSGELGQLKRINWTITDWYRSQSYYDSGGWRATWKGEGGGVLINQSPHQLDLLHWITGMEPSRIRAFCYFGKYRNIEVEDEVTAFLEYKDKATCVFTTSIGEAPGTNRLEIAGDRGKAVIEDGKFTFWRLRVPESEFNREYTGGFGEPECWKIDVPVTGKETGHQGITQNFVDNILYGTPLLATGTEGIKSLAASNAMQLSTWIDDWVTLPVNEDLYHQKLTEKIKQSKIGKSVSDKTLSVDGTY
ncbi:Gfo/Idh/MocA family protein [Alteribacter keqinensis]|uniref:Gfo/Idh/MocA family oxidoreductase n=1 Tax=Alteribacter keqinensis TaxID=2483800 RepID=A0A3M7TPJ6_9BACI|nr:Gfo/Idh/MocA family oxidoreductase [Alteribacter keqinensis]RNA67174.1 gfo/Idh/MocA family oxidoreductase [Alteribacter keqinensis]